MNYIYCIYTEICDRNKYVYEIYHFFDLHILKNKQNDKFLET